MSRHLKMSSFLPSPRLDQYFLRNPAKIAQLLAAAEIQPTDRVLELGAGIGSIAQQVPACSQLQLLELDPQLVVYLRQQLPQALVIEGDALQYLPQLSFDVLLSNLPWFLSESLLQQLTKQSFRVALMAVAAQTSITHWQAHFVIEEVALLEADDFSPPQPYYSRLLRLFPR